MILSFITDLSAIEPIVFLRPFLEVIRSEDTTGPITGLALTSVNKFLSYALIGMDLEQLVLMSAKTVACFLKVLLGQTFNIYVASKIMDKLSDNHPVNIAETSF